MKVDNSMTDSDFADSSVSKWVKISSSWVCFATYIWVLFAPIVLSDREFWKEEERRDNKNRNNNQN